MPNWIVISFLGILSLFLFSTFLLLKWYLKTKNRQFLISHYPQIIAIYDRARDSAYQKVYREKVLVQSASGFKIGQEELIELQKEYVNIIFVYCGESIKNDLIEVHGDLDSLVAFLASELIVKIENDEVYTSKMMQDNANLMEGLGMDNA